MQHPFGGIIIPQNEPEEPPQARRKEISRRSVLARVAGLPAAVLAIGGSPAFAVSHGSGVSSGYGLFYIVPTEKRGFSYSRAKRLNVWGPKLDGLPANKKFKQVPGHLAWMTTEQANFADGEPDVSIVHQIGPKDVTVEGAPSKGSNTLRIMLAPNDWRTRPSSRTYFSADALAKRWAKQLPGAPNLGITARSRQKSVEIWFGRGRASQAAIDTILAHPQVYQIAWLGSRPRPTTRRFGEDGVLPLLTTNAFGEEGGGSSSSFGNSTFGGSSFGTGGP